ncbi:MAG: heparinase II/III family protein, partial [Kiritimatiellae bacterium]|nr:heparinase II/III family protein [Kiritimatiellia bacterium]
SRVQTAEALTACHDGYRPVSHTRSWSWLANGLRIIDRLEGSGQHSVEIFFHFHPEVEVEQIAPGVVQLDGQWTLQCSKGQMTVADSHWASEFGKREPCKVAVVSLTERLPCEVVSGVERVSG